MNVTTFPCPHCKSPLRINNRAFVDCAVGCPECGEQLEVHLDGTNQAVARKVAPNVFPPSAPPKKSSVPSNSQRSALLNRRARDKDSSPQTAETRKSRLRTLLPAWGDEWLRAASQQLSLLVSKGSVILSTPVGIAWSVAGVVAIILLILAWPGESSVDQHAASQNPRVMEETPADDAGRGALLDVPSPEFSGILPDSPIANPPGDANALRRQLTQLGIAIYDYTDREGRFPVGTVALGDQPVEDRLSWMAEMTVRNALHATNPKNSKRVTEPQWDQPWNDPFNDRFVRQQMEGFLNPAIARRVGADRYPATHFVGVAGVGRDAPVLPVDHPRAGIFGFDRVTRLEDVKDGTAQTMLLAGASEQLGSWAAGGRPTLRAFTQEPYVEGPDGFGTGDADGMNVLMADGSVRFLSRRVSPVIVRRMASMADGQPLDESVPDKPNPPPPTPIQPPKPGPPVIAQQPKNPPPVPAKPAAPAEPKLPEPKLPEPMEEPLDIPAALALKIVTFEQLQDVPFRELLFQVEELCGVPIRRDADLPNDQAELWNQPVSLRLKDTTVRGILESLLEKAGLRYTIEKDHLLLYRQAD